jgi:hypothetical protein
MDKASDPARRERARKSAARLLAGRREFLKILPRNSIGAEIGVFRGQWTRAILDVVAPKELHLIDGWWAIFGEFFPWPLEHTGGAPLRTRTAYEDARRVAAEHEGGRAAVFHVEDDVECLRGFEDGYFDWVYLDTTHEYAHTVRELDALRCKIKRGGLITGHDWQPDPSHPHHGVCRAVREFCGKYGWRLLDLDDWFTQWAAERPI